LIGRHLAFLLIFASAYPLHPQALPTASRVGDAQIGAGFSTGKTGYTDQAFRGFLIYGDFDFNRHFGVEGEIHQIDTPNGDQSYQRTYEIGGRYFRACGPLVPYVKALAGRGQFNYPFGFVDLPYTIFAGGAGNGQASQAAVSPRNSSPSVSPITSPASQNTNNYARPS